MDVISLAARLIAFDTVNPPGNEALIARYAGTFLAGHGFEVNYIEYAEGRLHMIAEKGLSSESGPIVLSGHFDVVPAGSSHWSSDPFSCEVRDDRLYGRGSSDMKGALAAMMLAAVESFEGEKPPGGIRIIFSAAEELGCQGITNLFDSGLLPGNASAVIVGEPTGNLPAVAHKGAIYMNAVTLGKTAHSSMPELGDNAIFKAAEAILRIRDFSFGAENDPILGQPTVNIGMISGGMNINSVPDKAEFTIDVRTTSKVDHNDIFEKLKTVAGNEVSLRKFVDVTPVLTNPHHPFVTLVLKMCEVHNSGRIMALPYLTDGAVLQKRYGCPVVILGPGEPDQAHRTDEFCFVEKLQKSVKIYKNIIINWSRSNDRIS